MSPSRTTLHILLLTDGGVGRSHGYEDRWEGLAKRTWAKVSAAISR